MRNRLMLAVVLSVSGLSLALTLMVLPAGAAPAGTTYYVDPGGNNGHACTAPGPATACLTIGGALAKVAATGDTIVVAAGTYHEHLTIGKSVTINGAGASSTLVDGSATDRVITVNTGSSVTLSNLTIKNGHTTGSGGGIFNDGTLALNNSVVTTNTAAFYGGGIYSTHLLTLLNSFVLTNTAANGGGIYNYGPLFAAPAHALLDNSVVRGNTVITDGGGIYNAGVLLDSAELTLQNNTLVSLNIAKGGSGAGIYNNRALTLTNSTVSFNVSRGVTTQAGGGGLYNGPLGTLVVTSSSVLSNSATALGGGLDNIGTASAKSLVAQGNALSDGFGLGGGLYNEGQLSLDASTITGNMFGPSAGDGAGLFNSGSLTISASLISHNSAGIRYGGGAYNFAPGKLTIEDSTISNNSGAQGGGLYSQGGQTFVVDTTISGNQATQEGGGVYNLQAGATLMMTNTTVSGNQTGGDGGGIWSDQSVYLNNVTVAFNVAGPLGGGGLHVPITSTPVLTVLNTIIADNLSGSALDCSGSVASSGYNLIGNDQGCDFHPKGFTDQVGTANNPIDPLLNGLAPNGNPNGPFTDALFVGSRAIDAGSPFIFPNATACASTDERDVARPVGLRCDIGAFEGAVALFRAYLPVVRR